MRVYFLWVVVGLAVSCSVTDWLEKLVCEVTWYASNKTSDSAQWLVHFITLKCQVLPHVGGKKLFRR